MVYGNKQYDVSLMMIKKLWKSMESNASFCSKDHTYSLSQNKLFVN